MLAIEGISLAQGGFALAADWSVPAGTKIGVIGPSGGGKSTLLLGIAGFVAPTHGRMLWQGQDLAGVPPGKRPVSILFQDQNLFPHLTLAENLALGLSPRLRVHREDTARIGDALARTGLDGLADRKPGTLSGGQQSRAALARALLRARPILLLDEPFAALGPGMRAEMLALVTDVANETGATVLMVTHDPREARAFGEATVLVSDGVANAPVETHTLFSNPPAALKSYLGPA